MNFKEKINCNDKENCSEGHHIGKSNGFVASGKWEHNQRETDGNWAQQTISDSLVTC